MSSHFQQRCAWLRSLACALQAQAKGYAETPPDLDVDGIDTAHKLALVSAVSNGTLPAFDAVYSEGIRTIGEHVGLSRQCGRRVLFRKPVECNICIMQC